MSTPALAAQQKASDSASSLLALLKAEAERGVEAHRRNIAGAEKRTPRDRAHLAALASIGDITRQAYEMVQAGQSAEEMVARLRSFFAQEIANAEKNIRPEDV